jgi:two-component system sensor histidine kinase KdpD
LASILGSAGALRDYSTSLTDSGRVELLTTIVEEAERLNRFIANLLDMTRLESGAAAVSLTPLFIGDSVGSALRRAEKILALHRVDLAVPPDLPMVRLDPVLFEQVLFNLLDNARKYAPSGSRIGLRAWADESHVTLQVVDEGPGIPPDDLTRIFDSFYRVRKKDHVQAGTGLGLSICKGFVEAMGGTIFATNRADRPGAIFTLRFPIGPEPSTLEGRI